MIEIINRGRQQGKTAHIDGLMRTLKLEEAKKADEVVSLDAMKDREVVDEYETWTPAPVGNRKNRRRAASTARRATVVALAALSALLMASPAKAEDARIKLGVELTRLNLKDGSSARFRDLKLVKFHGYTVLCGQVNAKNLFGAYTGFKPFTESPNEQPGFFMYTDDPDIADPDMKSWHNICDGNQP